MTSEIVLPWGAWNAERYLKLDVPSGWETRYVGPAPAPPCSASDLLAAMANPIASRPLMSLVTPKTRVVLVVEDITRPAPLEAVVGLCMRQLEEAGVRQTGIRVLVALGAHGAMTEPELRQKLGSEVVETLQIVQHRPEEDTIDCGRDLYGKRVRLNRYLLESDLAILIGSVLPHPFAGFSGGAKLVFPGLSDVDTVRRSHLGALMGIGRPQYAAIEGNDFREKIENLVRRTCPSFCICLVCNERRQVAAVFVGDVVQAHRAACNYYRRLFTASIRDKADVLLLNAYPKDMDLVQSEIVLSFYKGLREQGAKGKHSVVVTTACSRGTGEHELLGARGSLRRNVARTRHLDGSDLMIFAPNVSDQDIKGFFLVGASRFDHWSMLCEELGQRHGQHLTMEVVPVTPMQIPVADRGADAVDSAIAVRR